LLAERADAEADIDVGGFIGWDEDELRGLLIEAGGFDADGIAAAGGDAEDVGAVGVGLRVGDGFVFAAFLEEDDSGLRNGIAEGIENFSAEGSGLGVGWGSECD
jgi:hypothetical protein